MGSCCAAREESTKVALDNEAYVAARENQKKQSATPTTGDKGQTGDRHETSGLEFSEEDEDGAQMKPAECGGNHYL